MSQFTLDAALRTELGKGASRRLRREGNVPAVIYGGEAAPQSLTLSARALNKAGQEDAFFTGIVELVIDGTKQLAVIMDIQRHQYKQNITHVDFERVTADSIVTKRIPVHFTNEDACKGVKDQGGVIQHTIAEVEIKCPAGKLPEFIEVDMAAVTLGQVVHLSDLVLPEGATSVELALGDSHNHAVVSVHAPKVSVATEEAEASEEAPAAE